MKPEDEAVGASQRTKVTFAALGEAKTIVSRPDDYILAMHPFERALAMQSADPVSQDAYLTFLAENVLAWSEDECDKLKNALTVLDAWLDEHRISAVEFFVLIKTSGLEMWNCAYTRSKAIVLPEGKLHAYPDSVALARLLAHEYFHILTRQHPRLRTGLYRLIGFHPLDPEGVELPEIIKQRMLTNPDAPHHDHYTCLSFHGKPIQVVPITMLKKKAATIDHTQDILNSVITRLLAIEQNDGSWALQLHHGKPRCLDLHQVTGWREYVGNSAKMVFDPEEILADCFVRLLSGENAEPAAKIVENLAALFPKDP